MRNVFYILLSLRIGSTSEFIIPSSRSEFLDDAILIENGLNTAELKTANIINSPKYVTLSPDKNKINLDKLQNKMKEVPLHEHEGVKKSNVDERSFIVIDSKYRVPFLNHFHNLQQQKEYFSENNYKTFVSNVGSVNELTFEDYSEPLKGYMENNPKYVDKTPVKHPIKPESHMMKPLEDKSKDFKAKIQAANLIMSNRIRHMGMKKHVLKEKNNNIIINTANNVIDQSHEQAIKKPVAAKINYILPAPNTGPKSNQYNAKEIKDKVKIMKDPIRYKPNDDHREYLELLKQHLVRPEVKGHSDTIATNSDDLDNLPNYINKYEVQDYKQNHNKYFMRAFSIPPKDFSDTDLIINKMDDTSGKHLNTEPEDIKDLHNGETKQISNLSKNNIDVHIYEQIKSRINEISNNKPCGSGHLDKPDPNCKCNQLNKGLVKYDDIDNEKGEISRTPISSDQAEEEIEEMYNKI